MVDIYKYYSNYEKYYAITINPKKTNYECYVDEEVDMDDIISDYAFFMYKLMEVMKPCTDYHSIFPEISPKGKLHFHGIVRITDMYKWFRTVVPLINDIGFNRVTKLDTPKEMITWSLYCRKDWHKNKEYFGYITPKKSKEFKKIIDETLNQYDY